MNTTMKTRKTPNQKRALQPLVRRRPLQLKPELMWAIAMPNWQETGLTLYTGTWLTRSEAIKEHTKHKGWDWKRCRRNGDVCLRVRIAAT